MRNPGEIGINFQVVFWPQLRENEVQVFERANMLVMLYRAQEGTVACTVPVQPLQKLLPPQQEDQQAVAADPTTGMHGEG